jgi:cobalt-zinc-cadmium efflux system membrane fusion protein
MSALLRATIALKELRMMTMVTTVRVFLASNIRRATAVSAIILLGTAAATLLFVAGVRSLEGWGEDRHPIQDDAKVAHTAWDEAELVSADLTPPLVVGKGRSHASGWKTLPVQRSSWPQRVRFTGRLELNAGRVAHVSSLVDGVIREVPAELGQAVRPGDILAYIDSREVGEAKLQLVKAKLQLASARRTNEWHHAIHENTVALVEVLRNDVTLDEVDAAFRDRPIGTYREQLVSALSRLNRAKADFERVRGLGASAVIPEKEVIRARAEHEAAAAAYRALKEQIRFDAHQRALEAQQELQAADAAVTLSRSHLLILGFGEKDIDSMDPIAEGERIAYYPVRSPIGGTVIARNAPLSQHVTEHTELFRIADLSTVWLRADVFEKDLDAVQGLQERSVTFTTGGYPGRSFSASVFSLGDLVAEETRAAPLLAVAENPDGRLKPGMFVELELMVRNDADVLQAPASAIQHHAGATFVFVADGTTGFQRRDVQLGRSTEELVEIRAGLAEGEQIVIQGGFALKSEMLVDLLAEE